MAPNLIFVVTEASEESVVQHSSIEESVDFLILLFPLYLRNKH